MPTIIGHALVGSALVNGIRPLLPQGWRRHAAIAGALVSIIPDADVVSFRLGIAYADHWGHRGFSHSLLFAAGTAFIVCLRVACLPPTGSRRSSWQAMVRLYLVLLLAAASHPLLDMHTDGGLGVALWAPWSSERLFFPVRPIPVSPIGIGPGLSQVLAWEFALFGPLFVGAWLLHAVKPLGRRIAVAGLAIGLSVVAFLLRMET